MLYATTAMQVMLMITYLVRSIQMYSGSVTTKKHLKYNQLLRIESELGDAATFRGRSALARA